MKLEVAALSETGYVRDENQDRISGSAVRFGHLYIVADGMGGHKGGALAAEMTVKGLQRYFDQAPENATVEEVIRAAFESVNQEVYLQAHSGKGDVEGMGSCVVLLLISGPIARVAHVGDSRAYLYSNGQLTQLTKDHTLVQKMVERGMLSAHETFNHPNANIIERAIGSKSIVEVDISKELRLNDGDAILLCSDGLTGYVRDTDILRVLRSPEKVQEIPKRLVDLALQTGGKDNVSVQFIQYGERKETSVNPQNISGNNFWKRFFSMVLIFFIGAAFSAGGSLFYLNRKMAKNDTVGQDLGSVPDLSAVEIEKLRKQIQVAETERDKAGAEAKKYRDQLTMAGNKNDQLQNKLADTQASLKKAQRVADLSTAKTKEMEEKLLKIQAERDAALSEIAICEQKLAAMNTEPPNSREIPF
jgi:PPM family protein phosphatase